MDDLTASQLALRAAAWEFAVEEVRPLAAEIDATSSMPQALRQKMAAHHFPAVLTPTELGGLGLGCFEVCLVAEGLAYGAIAVGATNMATTLCQTPIYLFGTRDQQEEF
ncbi:MAG: acyl-CoA dehydrogenase family protein, partial [Acidimicrobiia bacterium]